MKDQGVMPGRWTRRAVLKAGAAVVGTSVLAGCRPITEWLSSLRRQRADYYVAPGGDDRWSGTRERPTRAGTDGPVATLRRAQELVREHIAAGLDHDLTILVKAGDYYLQDGLFFGSKDSGTEGHAIIWLGEPGGQVNLFGGVLLTDWEPWEGEIWQHEIPMGTQPRQLLENGLRMPAARSPKVGYYALKEPVPGWERRAFIYDRDEVNPLTWDMTDASAFVWAGYDWFAWDHPIANLNAGARTVNLATQTRYPMKAGNRYLVRNSISLLTEPGECVIRPSVRTVAAWSAQEDIHAQRMVLSTAKHLIEVRGDGVREPVQNLHFAGLNLNASNDDVVRIWSAQNCSLRECRIENAGESGVHILGYARGITVSCNVIRYSGYCGVVLEGIFSGKDDINGDHLVENNHIHHCGEWVGHGAGVYITQSSNNQVLHNHIHHMPRYGTTIKGEPSDGSYPMNGADLDGPDRYLYLHSRNNLLAYNHIHHVNLDSQDTGAMESWYPGRDNTYDHNLIHDVGNDRFNLQSGFYLDDRTDYFTVTNNVLYGVIGTDTSQCVHAKGIGDRFENNVFIAHFSNAACIRTEAHEDHRTDNHIYRRNIMVLERPNARVYRFPNWSDDRLGSVDHNLVWVPMGYPTVSLRGRQLSWSQWREFLEARPKSPFLRILLGRGPILDPEKASRRPGHPTLGRKTALAWDCSPTPLQREGFRPGP